MQRRLRSQGPPVDANSQSSSLHQSTTLRITNLPPGTTIKILLDALALAGPFQSAVYDAWIEELPSGNTPASESPTTASLIMWTRDGAERILNYINARRLTIENHTAQARIIEGDSQRLQSQEQGGRNRVLILWTGEPELLMGSIIMLTEEFETQDVYMIDGEAPDEEEERRVLWMLVSTRSAVIAKTTLEGKGNVFKVGKIEYGADPIDVGVVTAMKRNSELGQ